MNAINLKRPAVPPHGTIIDLGGVKVRCRRLNPFDATLGERMCWDVLAPNGAAVESFYSRPGADDAHAALARHSARQVLQAAQQSAAARQREQQLARSRARGGFSTKRALAAKAGRTSFSDLDEDSV